MKMKEIAKRVISQKTDCVHAERLLRRAKPVVFRKLKPHAKVLDLRTVRRAVGGF